MITVIDYGMGNIHSVKKAIESCGKKAVVSNSSADILAAEKIVLPGVGAFDDAMQELKKKDLVKTIKDFCASGRPFLGICLGMQLLFEGSEEAKNSQGLGIVKGTVRKLSAKGFKVPHIGWNQVQVSKKECRLMDGVEDNSYLYFCHSYYPQVTDKNDEAGTCDYGQVFACIINRANVYGVQFHPEKSQRAGIKIIENFVNLC